MRTRRRLQRLGWAAGAALLLVLCGAVVLRTDAVTRALLTRILRASMTPEITLSTGPIRGNRLSTLHVADLRLRLGDTLDVLAIDTLALEYRLLPLLRRSVQLELVHLVAPKADLRDCVLDRLLPERGPASPAWSVSVERAAVGAGRATGGPCDAAAQWSVHDVRLDADGVALLPAAAARVELTGRIVPSGVPDGYAATAALRGSLADDLLTIDSLGLHSPASTLSAVGSLRRPGASDGAPEVDFDVRAEPLSLRDLEPFTRRLSRDGALSLRARVRGVASALDIDADAAIVDGGSVRVRATVPAWRDAPPRYLASVEAAAFSPATLLAGAPPGTVDGTAELDVEGSVRDRLTGSARVDLRLAAAEQPPADVEMRAEIVDGLAELSAELGSELGRATLRGRARPFGATPEVSLAGDVRWRRSGEPGADLLAGRVALAAAGAGPRSWSGRFDVGDATLGALAVDTVFGDVSLDGDRVEAALSAAILSGSVEADVAGRIGESVDLTITRGSFTGLDVSAADGWGEGLTALTGSLDGSWTDGVGRVAVAVGSSRIRSLVVDGGTVDVRTHADTLGVEADLSYEGGRVRIGAHRVAPGGVRAAPGAAATPAWVVREASFEGLDLAALRDGPPVTRLSGRLEGSGRGSAARTAEGRVALTLRASTVAGWDLDSARVDVSMRDGRADVRARAARDGTLADADGRVDVAPSGTRFEGDARVTVSDLGRALRRDDLPGSFGGIVTFTGDAPTGGEMRARAELRMADGRVRGVSVDSVHATVRSEGGMLILDTLRMRADGLVADARATAEVRDDGVHPSAFSLDAMLEDARMLRTFPDWGIHDLAEARMVATGSPVDGALFVQADLTGSGLLVGSTQVTSFAAEARGRLAPDRSLHGLRASGTAGAVEVGTLAIERVELTAEPEGEGVAATVHALVDATRNGRASVWLRREDGTTDVSVRALDLSIGDQTWTLAGEPRLRLQDGVDVSDFVLSSASGRITAEGVVRTVGTQALQLDMEGVRLSGIAELFGWSALEGVMEGSARVTGTADAPVVSATASAAGALRGTDAASVTMELRYQSARLRMDGTLDSGPARLGRFHLDLPMHLRLLSADTAAAGVRLVEGGPVSGLLEADDLALAWFAPFLPEEALQNLSGRMNAEVRAEGTTDRVALTGPIDVDSLAAFQPTLGLDLHGGSVRARLQGDRLLIDRLDVRSGGGSLSATGSLATLAAAPREVALEVTLDDFLAIRTDIFRGVVDGRLGVTGTLEEPSVTGALDVLGGDVHLGGRFAGTRAEEVELTAEDYEMLVERFGYRPPVEETGARADAASPLALAVDVRLGRDVWVRQRASPTVSVQLTGDLRVEKAPHELERVYGTLEAVPRGSHVEQFGRRFDITTGSVSFNGPPRELMVDIESAYRVPSRSDPTAPEVSIGLGVRGGLDSLRIVLSSDPEMENADIVSYLATGRPASQTLDLESTNTDLVERGATLALGRATDAVEQFASESVGLDVMEIRTEGVSGATVVAGRYVSPRLYLGFKQPVSLRKTESGSTNRARAPEIEIEYQAFRWLLLNLQRGGNRLEVFLRTRYAY